MRIGRFAVCQILTGLLWVPAAAADRIVLSREDIAGNNHQKHATEWQASLVEQDGTGQKTRRSSSYVEVASGLNYLDDQGVWHRSDPSFVPDGQGGFAALATGHKLRLASNLNADHAVEFTTEDGITLRSAPLALTYFDPESGERLTVAELRDTIPVLTQTNEVVYADAFSGIFASVRFRNQLDGIHQDIVLHEAPPPPEKLGLSTRSRLEIFTEFADEGAVPEREVRVLSAISDPAQRAALVEPDFTDETLRFGTNTIFAAGRAFYTGGDAEPGEAIPVGKRFLNQDGRRLLIEAVEHEKLAPLLKELPQAALSPEPSLKKWQKGTPAMLVRRQTKGQTRQLAAVRAYPGSGFVIDYEVKTGSANSFTFQSGVTYYVSSGFGVGSGSVSFSGGATIKFANNAYLYYYGTPYFYGSGANPIVFTSKDDNRFGEVIAGSTGNPTQMASPALWQYCLGPGSYAVQGIRVHWAKTGLRFDWNSGVTAAFSVTDSSFARCQTAIVSNPNGSPISAYLNNLKKCAVTTTFSGGYEGNGFVEDCAGDTDSDGLADTWELNSFGSLSQVAGTDPDGDGLTNMEEQVAGSNPLTANLLFGEALGPSSRSTGVVISEIMYQPAAGMAHPGNLEFIELFNSEPLKKDVSGYRISVVNSLDVEVVNQTLAANTVLLPGATYLALTPNLPDDYGKVRLYDKLGTILLELEYRNEAPWPISAGGTGHSLVLTSPTYGEADARAWGHSVKRGGSPGRTERQFADALRSILVNEVYVATSGAYVELFNAGAASLSLTGCYLSDDPAQLTKYAIPAGTVIPAGGHLAYSEAQLAFALAPIGTTGRKTVYFSGPATGGLRVWDAVKYGPQDGSRPWGRSPSGSPAWSRLSGTSQGTANAALFVGEIVINELMYNPISGDSDHEYVELLNRTGSAINLSGWQLAGGIQYAFGNVSIPANGLLVVARKSSALIALYPGILSSANTVGNYSGKLSNDGDLVRLVNSGGVQVNEVRYQTGGAWGRWSDGGGSSLELKDKEADGRLPSNWRDSDETSAAGWTTVTRTGYLDEYGQLPTTQYLEVILLGAGECLLDNVQVIQNGSNRTANSGFDSQSANWATGWERFGNHDTSVALTTGGNPGACLRLSASGAGDPGPNKLRVLLGPQLQVGTTALATISAQVRWLKGTGHLLFRIRGNYLDARVDMSLPVQPGSPGQANPGAGNAGPAITELTHTPVLPQAGQPILVTARVRDPNGINECKLQYRNVTAVSPGQPVAVVMLDNGTGGDALANDGLFTGSIPSQSTGTMLGYWIESKDALLVTSRFPATPDEEGYVRVGEATPAGELPVYRMWFSQATHSNWGQRHKADETYQPVTFVYGNSRVIHGVKATFGGSPIKAENLDSPTGKASPYKLTFPKDLQWLGSRDVRLDCPIEDNSGYREKLAYWMAYRAGLKPMHRRYAHLHVNGVQQQNRTRYDGSLIPIYEDDQRPDADLMRRFYPGSERANLFKIDKLWQWDANHLYPDTDSQLARLQRLTTINPNNGKQVTKEEPYRWTFRRVNDGTDGFRWFGRLIDAFDSYNASFPNSPDVRFETAVMSVTDQEQWSQMLALQDVIANFDSYGNDQRKNMYLYRSDLSDWRLVLWDLDSSFNEEGGPQVDLFYAYTDLPFWRIDGGQVSHVEHDWRRSYWRWLKRVSSVALTASLADNAIDELHALLQRSSLPIAATANTSIKQFVASRLAYINGQLTTVPSATFAATAPATSTVNPVTINGTAPYAVRGIRVISSDYPSPGIEYPIVWTGLTTWTTGVRLKVGDNEVVVVPYDENGAEIVGNRVTNNIYYSGSVAYPVPPVVINEAMPKNDDFEYSPFTQKANDWCEIYNNSDLPWDLSNYRIQVGSSLPIELPIGSILRPREYCIVWLDEALPSSPTFVRRQFQLGVKLENNANISLLGPIENPVVVDSFNVSSPGSNRTYGRYPDGSGSVYTFDNPSIGTTNKAP